MPASAFTIPDMSCQHCVQSITRAIQAADANAQVAADIAQHQISVSGSTLDTAALQAIITEVGYSPSPTAQS